MIYMIYAINWLSMEGFPYRKKWEWPATWLGFPFFFPVKVIQKFRDSVKNQMSDVLIS